MKKVGDLIILDGLEGNDRGDLLTTSQEFLLPYVNFLEYFWTMVFFLTLGFLVIRFILPLTFRKTVLTDE